MSFKIHGEKTRAVNAGRFIIYSFAQLEIFGKCTVVSTLIGGVVRML